jgi:hypothetical protein
LDNILVGEDKEKNMHILKLIDFGGTSSIFDHTGAHI